ncbi:MAG: hypothetical protein Q9N02_07300, partial [Ghiorsea sp.]|nr:hypothetical protein [Ghiorsea sp.]
MALTRYHFCVAALSLVLGATFAQSWELSPHEQQQVERGELVIHAESIGDGHIKEVQGLLKLNASPMRVFALI